MRVIEIDEREIIRRDDDRILFDYQFKLLEFRGRKRGDFFEMIQSGDRVFELPFPVIPIFGGDLSGVPENSLGRACVTGWRFFASGH